jgi:hypothetical protein
MDTRLTASVSATSPASSVANAALASASGRNASTIANALSVATAMAQPFANTSANALSATPAAALAYASTSANGTDSACARTPPTTSRRSSGKPRWRGLGKLDFTAGQLLRHLAQFFTAEMTAESDNWRIAFVVPLGEGEQSHDIRLERMRLLNITIAPRD